MRISDSTICVVLVIKKFSVRIQQGFSMSTYSRWWSPSAVEPFVLDSLLKVTHASAVVLTWRWHKRTVFPLEVIGQLSRYPRKSGNLQFGHIRKNVIKLLFPVYTKTLTGNYKYTCFSPPGSVIKVFTPSFRREASREEYGVNNDPALKTTLIAVSSAITLLPSDMTGPLRSKQDWVRYSGARVGRISVKPCSKIRISPNDKKTKHTKRNITSSLWYLHAIGQINIAIYHS